MAKKPKPNLGCGYAFAGVVALAGLALATAAVSIFRKTGGRPEPAAWVCAGLGAALVVAAGLYLPWARRAVAAAAAEERLRERHADEPWLWRKEWRGAAIKSDDGSQLKALWFFTVFWNALSAPLVWAMLFDRGFKGAAWIALVFPLSGIAFLVAALRLTLRRRKYGRPRFLPASVPGVIGGHLGGVIEVPARLNAEGDLRLVLRCVRRVTSGSGKNRRTTDTVLWEKVERIPPERIVSGPGRTDLPVLFAIPSTAEPSDHETSDRQTIWHLTAEAETPGVDFRTVFSVPVFATRETPASNTTPPTSSSAGLLPEYRSGDMSPSEWNATGVVAEADGWRFHAEALRGFKWGATLVAVAVAGGLAVGEARGDMPGVFWWIGGVFGGLAFFIAWDLWRARAELRFAGDEITVRRQTLLGWTHTRLPRSEVADVIVSPGMTAGTNAYFRLSLRRKGAAPGPRARGDIRFADHIRGRAGAERLREEVLTRLTDA